LGVLQPCSPDSVVGSVLAVDEILNEDRKVSDPDVEADRDGSGQLVATLTRTRQRSRDESYLI
jgi:hypothetical protein